MYNGYITCFSQNRFERFDIIAHDYIFTPSPLNRCDVVLGSVVYFYNQT